MRTRRIDFADLPGVPDQRIRRGSLVILFDAGIGRTARGLDGFTSVLVERRR